MSFSWSNAAEQMLAADLGMVPGVGTILAALVYIFWPADQENVWQEIEQQVEALIQQDLSNFDYQQMSDDLTGLQNLINDYLNAVNVGGGDPTYISEKWNDANAQFLNDLPHFQDESYQLFLLPLFGQFANMHLALLRDGALFGANWGWTPPIVQSTAQQLTAAIAGYGSYVQGVYQTGWIDASLTAPDFTTVQPFRALNTYVRQMTLTVTDFSSLWPYFDPTQYPKPVDVYLSREIYSDPNGTIDNSGPVILPSTPPTQPISSVTVWGWDRIDAAQVTYPANGGPNAETTTPRMGDQNSGSNAPPYGGVFDVSSNPITTAYAWAGSIVNAMQFGFQDGSTSNLLGGNYPSRDSYQQSSAATYSYPNEILSSVWINGISDFYGSADCVVFGFKYVRAATVDSHALKALYIASPGRSTPESLAARQHARTVDPQAVARVAAAEGWDAQREAFWAAIEAKAARA